jgi:hypothetical protein
VVSVAVGEARAEDAGDVDVLVERLRGDAGVQALWLEFRAAVAGVLTGQGFTRVSLALELSTHASDGHRVHLHCFASRHDGADGRARGLRLWDSLRFRQARAPHVVACMPGRGRMHGERAEGQGHYYLQAPKLGSVFASSSWTGGRDFEVRAAWVMALWRQRKLSHAAARREVVRTRERAHVYVAEIEKLERLEATLRSEAASAAVRSQETLRAFKPASDLEIAWLAQYTAQPPEQPPLRRFRVLVYDGPSRTGKTERACSWHGVSATLVLNCQGVESPCLHAWLTGRYRALVYDEADWRLVWGNRQLMQAGVHPVLLGQSACNEHAYSVLVHRVPMVLTSNAFWAGCPASPEREWIEANIFYCPVTTPTWQ